MATAEQRRERLRALCDEARGCTRCPQLVQTRTKVVFGAGNANADLMFVGEAPGRHEDEQGVPFVGAAGRLLGELLAGIGLSREDVFIANTLKCRPPENRDPQPLEIDNCSGYLLAQIELIQPSVICTLGNFATKLLRGDPTGVSKIHGQPEIRTFGTRAVRLLPVFHPAAALYKRATVELLREDFATLPALLALGPPPQPGGPPDPPPAPEPPPAPRQAAAEPALVVEEPARPAAGAEQMGLF